MSPTTQIRPPGIFVEEVPAGPRPIQAVGTSTAAFVGQAPKRDAAVGVPRPINNWSEFLRQFAPDEDAESTPLAIGVYGFFENGGTRCFVVNTGQETGIAKALDALRALDEVAIVAAPGITDVASHEALLSHCEREKDRVAILDAREDIDDITLLTQVETAEAPDKERDKGRSRSSRGEEASAEGGARPRQSNYGVIYFPWITIMDPFSNALTDVAPSGHMAGVWARTDATRGVHKAPA